MKLLPRRPAKAMTIKLNRSTKLEGKSGFYNGKHVTSRYVYLPEIKK